MKEKVRLDIVKIKNFCFVSDIVKIMKISHILGKKCLQKSDKELVFKTNDQL